MGLVAVSTEEVEGVFEDLNNDQKWNIEAPQIKMQKQHAPTLKLLIKSRLLELQRDGCQLNSLRGDDSDPISGGGPCSSLSRRN